jgi:hypothetical protein
MFSITSARARCLFFIVGIAAMAGRTQAADTPPATAENAASSSVPADVEKALQLPKGDEQTKALCAAASEWAKKDPVAALTWKTHLPRETPFAVHSAVTGTCALNSAKIAADWMVQNGKPPAYGDLHGLLFTWSWKGDPASAAAWCAAAPKGARDIAFFSVGDGWYLKDQPAACDWASKLEADDDRHSAIRGIALKWGRANIPAAGAWIKKLKADDKKVAARAIVSDWRANKFNKDRSGTRDEAAVTEWLDQFQLSDADREEITKDPAPGNKPSGTQK